MRGFDGSTRLWRFGLASLLWLTALLPLESAGAAPCRLPNRCAQPETITFLAGAADNFAPPSEAAQPSAELAAFLASINAPLRNFDDPAADLHLAHTFKGLPTGIVGARLMLSACSINTLGNNDALFLERTSGGSFAWGQSLPVLTGTPWTTNLCAPNLGLDLCALPPGFANNTDIFTSLLDGDLDLYLQDDTRVDFARLEVDRCPPVVCAPPPRGLRAWWPLDETVGTVAHDIAGNADGTHTNGPVPVAGPVAGALSFDGVNDHIVVADQAALDVGASPGGEGLDGLSLERSPCPAARRGRRRLL
jgi:hypothetical protein